MRSFLKIATGIDVMPVLLEVQRRGDLWNANKVRSWHVQSAHDEVDDIVLRYNRFDPERDDFVEAVCSSIDVVDYPPMLVLQHTRQLVMAVMSKVQGVHLGRVFISRMKPGAAISLHCDRIAPAEAAFPDRVPPAVYYDRYHVALASEPGCVFWCGGEAVYMAPGELWWFDNNALHEVANGSAEDRLHLVMDIRTKLEVGA